MDKTKSNSKTEQHNQNASGYTHQEREDKMKIEPKISGYAITDFEIAPLQNALTLGNFKKLSLRSINYILNNYAIYEDAKYNNNVIALLSLDDTYKIAILESYPEYEYEMKLYFGENWLNYYLRFNH